MNIHVIAYYNVHDVTRSDTLQYQSQSVDTNNISQRDQSKNVLINCR
jgi:hypothetical protein